MALTNSASGYGTLTKCFHWLIVILFSLLYLGGHIMTYIGFNASFAGIGGCDWQDHHSSSGIVAALGTIPFATRAEVHPPQRAMVLHSHADYADYWMALCHVGELWRELVRYVGDATPADQGYRSA